MSTGAADDGGIASTPAIQRARVLIAEDERHLGMLLEHYLTAKGHHVVLVTDGQAALDRLQTESFDVALLDIQMPKRDGLAVLRDVRQSPLAPEVIVMTGNGTVDVAVTAMQHGAYDYLAKPYRMAEVGLLVTRAFERRAFARRAYAATLPRHADALMTRYAPLAMVIDAVRRAAPSVDAMLVIGEVGTGRNALARELHHEAGGDVFLDIDCADAFGHGASNEHANASRLSTMLAAIGEGTLHLRRIDALPHDVQRALIDIDRPESFGARIVASTTHALDRLALDPELTTMLGGMIVELPPLRERSGDVALITDVIVRRIAPRAAPAITHAAASRLDRHSWPGNVPELRAVLERAVATASNGVIDVAHLGLP